MSDIARFFGYVGDGPPATKSVQPSGRLRRDWFNDLIRWCRDRGIKSFTAIAAYLGINRSTLWRWEQGTPPTSAHVDLIVAKTFGDVDPRMPARRATVHERVEKAVVQSLEMAATSRARTKAAKELNERIRIDLDESLRTLRGNGNGNGGGL